MAEVTYAFPLSRPVMDRLDRRPPDSSSQLPPPNRPFEYIDTSLSIVGNTLEVQDKGLKKAFKNLEERFETVDCQFKEVREEIKELREDMNRRFEDMDRRFEGMDRRFEGMDRRFEGMDRRFEGMDRRFTNSEARARNARAINSWSNIYPVGKTHLSPDGTWEHRMPENLPNKVLKFWHLQTSRRIPTLISLLQFYQIPAQEPQTEGLDTDTEDDDHDSEENEVSSSSSSFEEVVTKNPSMALEALAEHLGLDLVAIRSRMIREEQVRELQKEVTKQKRPGEGNMVEDTRPTKRLLDGEMVNGVFIPRHLIPDKASSKSSEPQLILGWDHLPYSETTPPRRHKIKDHSPQPPPPDSPLPDRSRKSSKDKSESPTQRIPTKDYPHPHLRGAGSSDTSKPNTPLPKQKR